MTDTEARAIRWGSQGPNHYSGELEVIGASSGSQVTVRLHTEHADGQGIVEGLAETLDHIKRNVEAGADPDAPEPV